MSSQNLSNSFVEEDLFGDYSFSDMQNSFNVTVNDNAIESICQELKDIFIEKIRDVPITELENKVFKNELKKLHSAFNTILSKITDNIQNNGSANIIQELNNLLQYCIDLLLCLQHALQIINGKVKLEYVESLPVTTCDILYLIFNHCKESDKIYMSYFEKLSLPLTTLFKKANEVQSIFLNILNNKVIFNLTEINEIALLANVSNLLVKIGIVVTNLDIKTAAELWKQLILLIETYTEILLHRLDVSVVINFLIAEILTGIDLIIKLEKTNDLKNIEKNLKIASFNLKIIIKLCNIYKENIGPCYEKILELLITLNGYSVPYLQTIGFNAKVSESFQTYLVAGTEPILVLMLEDRQFIQLYFKKSHDYFKNNNKKLGSIFLSVSLMTKMMSLDPDIQRQWLRNETDCNIICMILTTLQNYHCELMQDFLFSIRSLPGEPSRKTSLYEFLMLPTAALVVSLNCKQFIFIEKQLLQCLLQTDVWKALFAIDVWSIAARYASADMCYTQLNMLLEIFNCTQTFPDRPENIYLGKMCANLFSFLNLKYQFQIIEKYDIVMHPKLWKILKLLHYTNLQHDFNKDINNLLEITNQNIENFLKENFTSDNFFQLYDFMSVLADCPNFDQTSDSLMKNFTNNVIKLWHLNSDCDVIKATWFQRFTKIRCDITINILKYLNPSQILQVLNSLYKIKSSSSDYKIMIANILKELSNILIEESSEKNPILLMIQNLFQSIFCDENPIVKQKALETFDYFAHHTSHVEILTSVIGDNEILQDEVSSYLQRITKKSNSNEYWMHQNSVEFDHKCDVVLNCNEPLRKKLKLIPDVDLDPILQRMDGDTDMIAEYFKNNKMSEGHRNQMKSIVNKINNLL